MRRLVVNNHAFLWRVEHGHITNDQKFTCTETLRIFAEGNKSVLLRLIFRQQPEWEVGYPETGVVWSTQCSALYNLNRPAVISAIIAYVVPSLWNPKSMRFLTIEDAIPILVRAKAPTNPQEESLFYPPHAHPLN